jgi:hypothetical protein
LRYAILFSGMTERRNLNGLEFCYRTLVDCLGFHADNIQVLTYDGSLRTTDAPLQADSAHTVWPGDGSQHRIRVTGEGSREAFTRVVQTLKRTLTEDDLLFINTTGHGGDYGDGRGPFLVAYPRRTRYWVHDFCEDLAGLPRCRSLAVLMAQCFSGGFNHAVLEASPATQTFIASASSRYSYAMREDLNWDSFERNWIAALAGRDVDGAMIARQPDGADKGGMSVREAFQYAMTCRGRNPCDSPTCAAGPDTAGEMTLSEDTAAAPVLA